MGETRPLRVVEAAAKQRLRFDQPQSARFFGVDAHARPLVELPGEAEPVIARIATSELTLEMKGVAVLVVFEDADVGRPIVIGVLHERLLARPSAIEIDARTVAIEGKDEIVLRCGQGSITIRSDGQVIVRGTRLMSRASETNKIRGASVLIN